MLGPQAGSWQPLNPSYKGFGTTDPRVTVDALVEFDYDPATDTRVLISKGGGKIVTWKGEEEVTFDSGGWQLKDQIGGMGCYGEKLIVFWLDCPSGCSWRQAPSRQHEEHETFAVTPGERIFGQAAIVDDADGLNILLEKKALVEAQGTKLDRQGESRVRMSIDQQSAPEAERKEEGTLIERLPALLPSGPMAVVQAALNFREQMQEFDELSVLRPYEDFFDRFPSMEPAGDGAMQRAAYFAHQGKLACERKSLRFGLERDEFTTVGVFTVEPM